jgi:CRP-like cAMP-binding protein
VRDGTNFAEALLRETRRAGIDPAERRWPAGGFLYRQGFPTRGVLVLTGGLTKASILAANGAEVLVCLMGPGRLLGDVEYFRGCPALCSVVALEPVSAVPFDDADIPAVRHACPDFDLILGRALAAKLAENAERFERNFCYPLEYNVLVAALGRLGAEGRPVRKEELQEYLGVSPRHLNRVLASLAADGLIRVESGSVAVADERAVRARIARTEEE